MEATVEKIASSSDKQSKRLSNMSKAVIIGFLVLSAFMASSFGLAFAANELAKDSTIRADNALINKQTGETVRTETSAQVARLDVENFGDRFFETSHILFMSEDGHKSKVFVYDSIAFNCSHQAANENSTTIPNEFCNVEGYEGNMYYHTTNDGSYAAVSADNGLILYALVEDEGFLREMRGQLISSRKLNGFFFGLIVILLISGPVIDITKVALNNYYKNKARKGRRGLLGLDMMDLINEDF